MIQTLFGSVEQEPSLLEKLKSGVQKTRAGLVSALVAFVNGALVDPRACVKRWAAVALILSWSYGAIRLGTIEMREGPKIALVQPNIPQDLKTLSRESEQQAVENYHWLKPGEMLDGLGMAETTPGPLIMVLQFVGFMAAFRDPGGLSPMLAGTLGGLLATWVTFTPCFLWIFLGAPFVEKLRGNKSLNAALSALTAAVVGVILNLAIWFAIHTIFRQTVHVQAFPLSFDAPVLTSVNGWALALSVAAAVAIFRFKAGMIPTLAACCAAGVVLHLVGALT